MGVAVVLAVVAFVVGGAVVLAAVVGGARVVSRMQLNVEVVPVVAVV